MDGRANPGFPCAGLIGVRNAAINIALGVVDFGWGVAAVVDKRDRVNLLQHAGGEMCADLGCAGRGG